jgi:oxygen-independent coproporphyrinogen III oxidase
VPLGIYISVPFCRTKCTYCNFASDVFSRALFARYLDRVCDDVGRATEIAREMGGALDRQVDSIYLGGGTPTLLDPPQFLQILNAIRGQFDVAPTAEITVECAPGTLAPEMVQAWLHSGVNRVSLGVQSFVDGEAASVGRLHKRATVRDDLSTLRRAGIANINIDLIAGLPHQTAESWAFSLEEAIASGVSHASIYILEVDQESRLGRELIAGGTRYHAHFVPDENAVADYYLAACDSLAAASLRQYEISNFARSGFESRHNLKYWTRQPYLGFGVDAHSMLPSTEDGGEAVRFCTPDSLEKYLAARSIEKTAVSRRGGIEELFFLGLRLNQGVRMAEVARVSTEREFHHLPATIADLIAHGLLEEREDFIRLTYQGRLLSNEVFERFLSPLPAATKS